MELVSKTKKKQTHKYRKQTSDYHGEREWEKGKITVGEEKDI